MVKRRVSLFGATGSIGQSAVDVLKRHADKFDVVSVAANTRAHELADIAIKLNAKRAIVCDADQLKILRGALSNTSVICDGGEEALLDAAGESVDLVIMAISGAAGLRATFAAARTGTNIALATKESIVCAGDLLMQTVRSSGAHIFPVDSEHNALFQIMSGRDQSALQRVTLTASGGPFRDWPKDRIAMATPKDALAHPVWSMGEKISVDCASMMNKGLELIEAQHLFSLKSDQLNVLVHPQSVIHALVSYIDGSVLAQMAKPDMRVALSSCLDWPHRMDSGVETLNLAEVGSLTFLRPDENKFPCLRLAREAMEEGGALPCIMNAANEIAVSAFLRNELGFAMIPDFISTVMKTIDGEYGKKAFVNLEDVLEVDSEVRKFAASLLPQSTSILKHANIS